MQRSEVAPRGGTKARPAGDGGPTSKASFLQRFGDALAVGGALAELRCGARGDCRIETFIA
jgi:hypothetical protein